MPNRKAKARKQLRKKKSNEIKIYKRKVKEKKKLAKQSV
tara:strand:+ start:669 stop:785 length:117 start_codon:yes stop_codon:yes gene_type:complete